MSNGNWRNGFTVGLAVGFLATLVFILYGQELYSLANCIAQTEHCDYPSRYKDGDEPQWWSWVRRLVETEDTLAQWIMVFLTIAATGVLIFTLRAANKTNAAAVEAAKAALDANKITREIGQAQSRAYISIEGCQIWFDNVISVRPKVRNCGNSPALDLVVVIELQFVPVGRGDQQTRTIAVEFPDINAGDTFSFGEMTRIGAGRLDAVDALACHAFISVFYSDIFDFNHHVFVEYTVIWSNGPDETRGTPREMQRIRLSTDSVREKKKKEHHQAKEAHFGKPANADAFAK